MTARAGLRGASRTEGELIVGPVEEPVVVCEGRYAASAAAHCAAAQGLSIDEHQTMTLNVRHTLQEDRPQLLEVEYSEEQLRSGPPSEHAEVQQSSLVQERRLGMLEGGLV